MSPEDRGERIRILRVIARLNAGGPAYHVSLLSGRLDPARYETLLVAGEVGPGEASMADVAAQYGARLETVDSLGPQLNLRADLQALRRLIRIVRSFRPHVVHTHTSKAGFLGRLAACMIRPRPVIVHTFHGHVLEGYFNRPTQTLYRLLERGAARVTDRIVAVSQATADDLMRLRVASERRIRVIPLGLELDDFQGVPKEAGAGFRAAIGTVDGQVVATYVGRLVPIKNLTLAIDALAIARRAGADIRLALVGDGEARPTLEQRAAEQGIDQYVAFTGYRRDLKEIIAGTDIAVLSSINEGTPVFLIQAAAGGRPAVATSVGGVRDVVTPETGIVVPAGDADAFASAITTLATNEDLRFDLGRGGASHVQSRYAAERLITAIGALYAELLADRGRLITPTG